MASSHPLIGFVPPPITLQTLPPELLDLLMLWTSRMVKSNKNAILPLRLVCKTFNKSLRPLVFKTVQLETSKFMRSSTKPRVQDLQPWGSLCEAIYLDMMVIRDEEEVTRLANVFRDLSQPPIPEMPALLASFGKYCMGEHTFDERDFASTLESVVEVMPNVKRFRLSLPFQVVGQTSVASTLLLATTFSILAKRPEDHKTLETLVIDHLSDLTVNLICNNHMDLRNSLRVFLSLKNLVLSIRRNETEPKRQAAFEENFWFLLRQAHQLESLCLVGWNAPRDPAIRKHQHSVSFRDWNIQSLPYTLEGPRRFTCLKYLDLKRLDIDARIFIRLITEVASSLKELYLNDVYLKIFSKAERGDTCFWIGQEGMPKPEKAVWVADALRNIENLKLDILRVTGLGYDDFAPDPHAPFYPHYDLKDSSPFPRSFDQRFVDAVMGRDPFVFWSPETSTSHVEVPKNHPMYSLPRATNSQHPFIKPRVQYDAELYQRLVNDPTSTYRQSIDGLFFNHNGEALKELHVLIALADRGMSLISEGIDRARRLTIDNQTGLLTAGPPEQPGLASHDPLHILPSNVPVHHPANSQLHFPSLSVGSLSGPSHAQSPDTVPGNPTAISAADSDTNMSSSSSSAAISPSDTNSTGDARIMPN